MSLDGTRLKTALKADILAQIQSLFPINASLLTAEKAALQTAQNNMAQAIAYGSGPDIVSEITTNAVVNRGNMSVTPSLMSNTGGALTGDGELKTGTGTVS